MSARPADYDADPDRFLSSERYPHDDVHPYVAQRFAAAGARTVLDVGGGNGRLARLLPALSMRCVLNCWPGWPRTRRSVRNARPLRPGSTSQR